MLNESTDSFFLFSRRLSSTSKARRRGWSCPRRKCAGRLSSPRAVSSQTPATPTPPLTTKDLRTVNCPGHPHPHIAPPHVTGRRKGVRRSVAKGLPQKFSFFLSSFRCLLHTCIQDSQTQWLEGLFGGDKTRKKGNVTRNVQQTDWARYVYSHSTL